MAWVLCPAGASGGRVMAKVSQARSGVLLGRAPPNTSPTPSLHDSHLPALRCLQHQGGSATGTRGAQVMC